MAFGFAAIVMVMTLPLPPPTASYRLMQTNSGLILLAACHVLMNIKIIQFV